MSSTNELILFELGLYTLGSIHTCRPSGKWPSLARPRGVDRGVNQGISCGSPTV